MFLRVQYRKQLESTLFKVEENKGNLIYGVASQMMEELS